MFGDQKF